MADAPYLTTKAAVGDDVQTTALRLNKSPSYIQQMTEGPEKDRYSRFIQLYLSVSDGGAEIFFKDFERRHYERMGRKVERQPEQSEVMEEYFRRQSALNDAAYKQDDEAIVKEGGRLIHTVGDLIAMARSRIAQLDEESEGSRPMSMAR